MIVVGLTGGIATGKSTVAAALRDLGVPVIDADQVARAVVSPGHPALQALVETFGPEVLSPDGTLDRAAMRARIARNPDARRALEGITHPAIRQAIGEQLIQLAEAGQSHAVVEAALLVETGSYRQYPVLVVVTCAPETQLLRVMERDGMSEADARALIATQLPLKDKEAVATHVLHNDGTREALRAATRRVWAEITR